MKGLLAVIVALGVVGPCNSAVPGLVEDPAKCTLQWETRLKEHRALAPADGWPELIILDAEIGGDEELARNYMEEQGWFAAASETPSKTLYLLPNKEPFGRFPAADQTQAMAHACKAAWISRVPFTKVIRRGAEGQGVIYEVEAK